MQDGHRIGSSYWCINRCGCSGRSEGRGKHIVIGLNANRCLELPAVMSRRCIQHAKRELFMSEMHTKSSVFAACARATSRNDVDGAVARNQPLAVRVGEHDKATGHLLP